jgi:hypothetical protein
VQMWVAGAGQVVKAQLVIHDEQNIHGRFCPFAALRAPAGDS